MQRRTLGLFLLFALIFSFVVVQAPANARPNAQAATPQVAFAGLPGTVNSANNLTLRALPSTDSANLGILKAGAKVTVFGQNTNGTWLFITDATGKIGWVGSAYVILTAGKLSSVPIVQPSAATVPCAGDTIVLGKVNTEALELRTQPNTGAERLGTLKAGYPLTILGQNKAETWLFVRTSDNLQGWVASAYVFLTKGNLSDLPILEATPATAAANATATIVPTVPATPVATAACATLVPITPTVARTVKGKINTESLILRNLPANTGEKLTILKAGDEVTVLAQNQAETWLQVETKDGLIGWVASPFVFLSGGTLNDLPKSSQY